MASPSDQNPTSFSASVEVQSDSGFDAEAPEYHDGEQVIPHAAPAAKPPHLSTVSQGVMVLKQPGNDMNAAGSTTPSPAVPGDDVLPTNGASVPPNPSSPPAVSGDVFLPNAGASTTQNQRNPLNGSASAGAIPRLESAPGPLTLSPAVPGPPSASAPQNQKISLNESAIPPEPFTLSPAVPGDVLPGASGSPLPSRNQNRPLNGHGSGYASPGFAVTEMVSPKEEKNRPRFLGADYMVGLERRRLSSRDMEIELVQDVRDLRKQLESKTFQYEQLQQKFQFAKEERKEHKKKMDELRDYYTVRISAMEKANNKEKEMYKSEIERLKEEVKSKEEKITVMNESFETLKLERDREVAIYEREKMRLEYKIIGKELKISQLQTLEQSLKCELAEAKESAAVAQRKLAESKAATLEETNATLEEANATLEEANANMEEELHRLSSTSSFASSRSDSNASSLGMRKFSDADVGSGRSSFSRSDSNASSAGMFSVGSCPRSYGTRKTSDAWVATNSVSNSGAGGSTVGRQASSNPASSGASLLSNSNRNTSVDASVGQQTTPGLVSALSDNGSCSANGAPSNSDVAAAANGTSGGKRMVRGKAVDKLSSDDSNSGI